MRLFVTVFENSVASTVAAIRALDADHDGVEIRVERFETLDLAALRAATGKPIILTSRGRPLPFEVVGAALDAGFELVDVEYEPRMIDSSRFRDRIVLSHHDYEAMGDLGTIAADMQSLGCAHTKVAVTPASFADNERLLSLLASPRDASSELTVIGMGERGLYSRILAPFKGSALTFVAADTLAAPGQLTHESARAIYGEQRAQLICEKVFAVIGRPAGHSRSPQIHNRLFRQKGLPAGYTIASLDRFEEIEAAFLRGEPCGLSITAPFKEEALAFAERIGAEVATNARESGAVNTVVNYGNRMLADNTDVDAFETLLRRTAGAIAIAGAGGTARAALLAARRLGRSFTLFNRTAGPLGARSLDELRDWRGEIVINTTPVGVELPSVAGLTVIQAAYGHDHRAIPSGTRVISGLELLEAQAIRQNELFTRVFER
ncbi:MAG TPA: type I 3-dehydroquinate dehydratase [Thermoanaerobaculia bacterium]